MGVFLPEGVLDFSSGKYSLERGDTTGVLAFDGDTGDKGNEWLVEADLSLPEGLFDDKGELIGDVLSSFLIFKGEKGVREEGGGDPGFFLMDAESLEFLEE